MIKKKMKWVYGAGFGAQWNFPTKTPQNWNESKKILISMSIHKIVGCSVCVWILIFGVDTGESCLLNVGGLGDQYLYQGSNMYGMEGIPPVSKFRQKQGKLLSSTPAPGSAGWAILF